MAEIFISYKSDRRPAARHIKAVLECYFQSSTEDCVWYDYALIPGEAFAARIEAELQAARVVIVLWCEMAVTSRWVLEEARSAARMGKLVPCRIENCLLPEEFAATDTISLTHWDGSPRSHVLDRLLDDAARRLGRPAVASVSRLREVEEVWRSYGAPTLAHFALGKPLEPGQGAPPAAPKGVLGAPPSGIDPNLAQQWASASEGSVEAMMQVAWTYFDGRGRLPQDIAAAARLWSVAAERGNGQAIGNLGYLHKNGLGGFAKDPARAVECYRLAADLGNAYAQENLGLMYRDGDAVQKDEREATRLFQLAAAQGSAAGQFYLGWMHQNALGGLRKDEKEAGRLYALSVAQGHTDAQNKGAAPPV